MQANGDEVVKEVKFSWGTDNCNVKLTRKQVNLIDFGLWKLRSKKYQGKLFLTRFGTFVNKDPIS